MLLADDAANTLAYGRATGSQAAIVAINRNNTTQTLNIPVNGYLPNGTTLARRHGVGNSASGSVSVANGAVQVTLAPLSGLLLVSGNIDLTPPDAPANLHVTSEGNATVGLAWNSASGAAGYNIYRSPVSGGGWVKVGTTSGTTFTDTSLQNARSYYYAVTALDSIGNESAPSAEISALPHLTIGWANLQWPPSMAHIISTIDRTDTAYGQVWIDGETNKPGPTNGLIAQLGFGPQGSNPASNSIWVWVDASFNTDAGNNDEFKASMLPDQVGTYDYVYRYTTTNGRDWLYADLNGPIASGQSPANPGKLTVSPSSDTTPPVTPTGLAVASASPAGVKLQWNAVVGDATLYGYEVRRGSASGGPYSTIATVSGANDYLDTNVTEGATYYYVVRAVDTSFNRSADSNEVGATAQLRTVTVKFNVTVPSTTDATGRSVHIAGFLDRFDGGFPQWDPGAVALAHVDATHWTITFTGKENTPIEYKYTLGDWDHVEKDDACGEIANRQITLSYGASGAQNVNDTVLNWRNVAPCGN
jgi:hypothetical protein